MGLESFFKHKPQAERIAKLDDASKFLELEKAVGRNDLEHVKDALAAGANASYEIRNHYNPHPMDTALDRNRIEIFKAILETPGGQRFAAKGTSPEGTVLLKKKKPDEAWFMPSYLYAAIKSGKHEIALALALSKAVDVEYYGHMMRNSDLANTLWTEYKPLIKPMMELAVEKGMPDVAGIIEERIKSEAEQKRLAALQKKNDEAAALRKQAEELLKKAETLSPVAAQTPPRKPGKLNI